LAITSAPCEWGETTDQLRTTTAELNAPQRSTMVTSEQLFTLDNRRGPIWGSRGREFKSRQPDPVCACQGQPPPARQAADLAEFHENFTPSGPERLRARWPRTGRLSGCTGGRARSGPPPCARGEPPPQPVVSRFDASSGPACGGRCRAVPAGPQPYGTTPRSGPSTRLGPDRCPQRVSEQQTGLPGTQPPRTSLAAA